MTGRRGPATVDHGTRLDRAIINSGITIASICERCGISPQRLQHWRRTGRLPLSCAIALGNLLSVEPASLSGRAGPGRPNKGV